MELTRYKSSESAPPSPLQPGLKRGNIFPPSAHAKFTKWKNRIGGSSGNNVEGKEQGGSRPGSRRTSLDVERPYIPPQAMPNGPDFSKSISIVATATVEIGPNLMKPLPSSQFQGAVESISEEKADPPMRGDAPQTSDAGTTNEVNSLQKSLKRAQMETAEAREFGRKLEAQKKLLEDKLIRHGLTMKSDQGDLRRQYQEAEKTRSEIFEKQLSDQQALKFQQTQDILRISKERDEFKRKLDIADQDLNDWWDRCDKLERVSTQQQNELTLLRTERDSLSNDNAALQNQMAELNLRCEDQKQLLKELEDLGAPAIELEGQESNVQLVQLRTEHMDAIKEVDRLREQLNRLLEQRLSEVTVADPYYFDDPYFKRQFSYLRGSIKELANRAFSSDITNIRRKLPEALERRLEAVCDHYDLYLKSAEHRPSFIQAFIWTYLLRHILGQKFWEPSSAMANRIETQRFHTSAGKLHSASEEYQEDSRKVGYDPELRRLFHQHRYAAARYAAPKGTELQVIESWATQRIDRAVKDIRDSLEMWWSPMFSKAQSGDKLRNILHSAVCLDLTIHQQKAEFEIFGAAQLVSVYNLKRPYNIVYNPKTMDVRLGSISERGDEQRVELFITPLLVKKGNADGQDYERSNVLEKAEVDLDRPRSKRSFFG
ncbi:uncharacterized protein PAC_05698 [Phialocephala subalpina]|uniref:Uncharacterized protein n=1 Tax=Phialocephala subalpina TaxID=576137 RepID=A0A1L7WSR0_9HELO|nr:uncharacterized protein PAC_05698 [Phialocephala subalpina]